MDKIKGIESPIIATLYPVQKENVVGPEFSKFTVKYKGKELSIPVKYLFNFYNIAKTLAQEVNKVQGLTDSQGDKIDFESIK